MKKATLHLPDELFNHLTSHPQFLECDCREMPVMLLSPELVVELDVLYKLSHLYYRLEDETSKKMEKACNKRINEIEAEAIKFCKRKHIKLMDVAGIKDCALKVPLTDTEHYRKEYGIHINWKVSIRE